MRQHSEGCHFEHWPNGTTMKAAISGPSDQGSKLPPTWNRLLRQAVATARGGARGARSLGMEDSAADADQRHRGEQRGIGKRVGERHQPDQREHHRRRQREGRRAPIERRADDRLQQRRGDLEGERDYAGLKKGQRILFAEHRIERRRERPGLQKSLSMCEPLAANRMPKAVAVVALVARESGLATAKGSATPETAAFSAIVTESLVEMRSNVARQAFSYRRARRGGKSDEASLKGF